MSHLDPLLERNLDFAPTGAHVGLGPIPKHQAFVITCMDSRIDPAHILGVELGDALVFRNGGGRVTDDVLRDIAFVAAVTTMMSGGEPPTFEVAVIHHTGCGSAFLADDSFRSSLAATTGSSAASLEALAVTDPNVSVGVDVAIVRDSAIVPSTVSVSGHVYDVDTGIVTTVHPATTLSDPQPLARPV